MSDRRRILGPQDAKIPLMGASSGAAAAPGGEKSAGVRSFFVKSGFTKNANGLAYLEVDNTIVEVAVYGPRPIKGLFIDRASFSVECKFLPYITQPNEVVHNGSSTRANGRTGLTNIEQKISTYVETAFLPAVLLEKYPKSTIDVFVRVIAFDANTSSLLNLISWIVNCASVAMVDSGIELRDLVSSGHARVAGDKATVDAQIWADSDASAGCECVASYMAMQNNELVAVWVQGNDDAEVTPAVLEALLAGCQDMSTLVRQNLNGYLRDSAEAAAAAAAKFQAAMEEE